jgi:hypothetical protein
LIFLIHYFSVKTPKALTLALSRWEREPEEWIGSPRPLGEGLGVRAYNFCQSTREKTHQFSLFNDEGNAVAIDEPVKDFPLIHFLKLSESEFSGLKDAQDE